jgi:hypothetical protein
MEPKWRPQVNGITHFLPVVVTQTGEPISPIGLILRPFPSQHRGSWSTKSNPKGILGLAPLVKCHGALSRSASTHDIVLSIFTRGNAPNDVSISRCTGRHVSQDGVGIHSRILREIAQSRHLAVEKALSGL